LEYEGQYGRPLAGFKFSQYSRLALKRKRKDNINKDTFGESKSVLIYAFYIFSEREAMLMSNENDSKLNSPCSNPRFGVNFQ